jgi:hypothetical protein
MVYDIQFPEGYSTCYHDRHHDITPEIKKREETRVVNFDQGDPGNVLFGNFCEQEQIKTNPDHYSGNDLNAQKMIDHEELDHGAGNEHSPGNTPGTTCDEKQCPARYCRLIFIQKVQLTYG